MINTLEQKGNVLWELREKNISKKSTEEVTLNLGFIRRRYILSSSKTVT